MATREELRANWDQVKERVQGRWNQMTDDELREGEQDAGRLVDAIQRKTGAAKQEIETFVEETIAKAKPVLDRAKETVKDYAHQAGETVQHGYDQAATSVKAGYEQAEVAVRRHPMESVAVAFGAGLIAGVVVGLMTGRRT